MINNNGNGLIEGGRHGITVGAANNMVSFTLNVTNQLSAIIQGDNGSGMNIDGFNANEVVTIQNDGTITGNGVTGDGDGVDVDGLVDLTNTGVIQSLNAFSDEAVNVDSVAITGHTVTRDRPVVLNRDNLVGVEAIDVHAGAVVALDDGAQLISDVEGEADRVIRGPDGDAVATAFDEAVAVVVNHKPVIALPVDTVAAAPGAGNRLNRSFVDNAAVHSGADAVRFRRLRIIQWDNYAACCCRCVIALPSITCTEPPAEAFSEMTLPKLSKEILLFGLFIWMASASAACRSAPALFGTVRVRPPVLSRIARPVPVCLIMPSFCIEEVPVTVMATLLPLTCKLPVELITPAPLWRVCAAVRVPAIRIGPGTNWARPVGAARRARVTREKVARRIFMMRHL